MVRTGRSNLGYSDFSMKQVPFKLTMMTERDEMNMPTEAAQIASMKLLHSGTFSQPFSINQS